MTGRSSRRAWFAAAWLVNALAATMPAVTSDCRGVVFLTFDTGDMRHAEEIARILRRHEVRATFFLANERTFRGDDALGPSWGAYWKARTDEGHAFGSHTWRHGRFAADTPGGGVRYRPQFGESAGHAVVLSPAQVCEELGRVNDAFTALTGRRLDALWRAPGGTTTPNALAAARACGYSHVHWADAGFLGDELPSETYPNDKLLARALERVRDGDVLMAHLGIRSRREPFAPMIDPLIGGLKRRGLCFRTLREHPQYRAEAGAVPAQLAAATR
ncbi:MAG: polysaccharide deacetylase family protein [Burkholderiaceae bacterium]|nr:polysaccharide deacetylase family protein [Burkholderiaceae bacterium]